MFYGFLTCIVPFLLSLSHAKTFTITFWFQRARWFTRCRVCSCAFKKLPLNLGYLYHLFVFIFKLLVHLLLRSFASFQFKFTIFLMVYLHYGENQIKLVGFIEQINYFAIKPKLT